MAQTLIQKILLSSVNKIQNPQTFIELEGNRQNIGSCYHIRPLQAYNIYGAKKGLKYVNPRKHEDETRTGE